MNAIVVTVWELFVEETETRPAHWSFNHIELAQVPVGQTHPVPKKTVPGLEEEFANQAKQFTSGTWQHYERLRYEDGKVM